jgi:5'-deoxynucleotidase YfbR-like HD superfamily hydrolase
MKLISKDLQYLETMKAQKEQNMDESELAKFVEVWNSAMKMKNVLRCAGVPTIKPYNVAQHCFYTGLLFKYLADIEGLEIGKEDMMHVFLHDILETVTGDILFPAKHLSVNTEQFWTAIEIEVVQMKAMHLHPYCDDHHFEDKSAHQLFKDCDLLELLSFCMEEIRYGNTHHEIIQICDLCHSYLDRSTFAAVRSFTQWIAR